MTPVINADRKLFIKLEYLQVGGSHKSRAAERAIRDAESFGYLKRDGRHVILEKSGGNFGIGLAAHASPLKYKVKLLVRPSFSAFRRQLLSQLGVELIGQAEMKEGLSNQQILDLYTQKLSEEGLSVFFSDQFNNPSCIAAHEDAATEFVGQLKDRGLSEHDPLTLVKCVGSGASLRAYGAVFATHFHKVKIVVAQPAGCDFEKAIFSDHPFEGASVGMTPPFLSGARVDTFMTIDHLEASQALDELFAITGSFAGRTTGLAYAVAKRLLVADAAPVAMLAYDAGDAYLADDFLKAKVTQPSGQTGSTSERCPEISTEGS